MICFRLIEFVQPIDLDCFAIENDWLQFIEL